MNIKNVNVNQIDSSILRNYFGSLKLEYGKECVVYIDGMRIDYSPREIVLIEIMERLIKESENRIIESLKKK